MEQIDAQNAFIDGVRRALKLCEIEFSLSLTDAQKLIYKRICIYREMERLCTDGDEVSASNLFLSNYDILKNKSEETTK